MTVSGSKDAETEPKQKEAGFQSFVPPPASSSSEASPAEIRPTEEDAKPRKKRYYNPREVMQKKGCIGCGGMALALLAGFIAVVAVAL